MYKNYSVMPSECTNVFNDGKIIGFTWKILCPHFRNIFLHEIKMIHARVDNIDFNEDDITLGIEQKIYSLYDFDINNYLWKVNEKATLFIPYEANIKQGFHMIEVGISIKINLVSNRN